MSERGWTVELPGGHAFFSSRNGGVSRGPYRSLNLGILTDDDREAVTENRGRVADAARVPAEHVAMGWQVHGADLREWTDPPTDHAFAQLLHLPGNRCHGIADFRHLRRHAFDRLSELIGALAETLHLVGEFFLGVAGRTTTAICETLRKRHRSGADAATAARFGRRRRHGARPATSRTAARRAGWRD